MPQPQIIDAPVPSTERPACPKCKWPMWLTCIEPDQPHCEGALLYAHVASFKKWSSSNTIKARLNRWLTKIWSNTARENADRRLLSSAREFASGCAVGGG